MNARLKFALAASALLAALAGAAACGRGRRQMQSAHTTALVAAPARLLAQVPAPEAAGRAFTPVVAPADGLELAEESLREKNEKRKYEIELAFPQLRGRLTPQAAKFNRVVRALAEREARDFKSTFAGAPGQTLTTERVRDEGSDSLAGGYEIIHLTGDLVSLRFRLQALGRGAAQPVQFNRVINFDLKAGRALQLGDLFASDASYLDVIASRCVAELKRQDEEEHRRAVRQATGEGRTAGSAGARTPDSDFEIGAGSTAENYAAWNLAGEGVVVTFAVCQVLGCAAGEREVLVPYSALGEILDGGGPAARLITQPPR